MTYDPAGNLTYDSTNGSQGDRVFDAENRMTAARGGVSAAWQYYVYDGEGKRIKRNITGGDTWQVYGLGGELIAEYTSNGTQLSKEYGYRNGQLLITAAVASTGWGAPPTIHDNPLVVGETTIQSRHITELRDAINALRSHLNMSQHSWTTAANPGDWITADPILEMRIALDEALGPPSTSYTAGLAQNQPILAAHIQELRNRVLAAWNSGTSGTDVRWLVADQLGTPRIILDQSGSFSSVTRHDYLPFGEELTAGARTWNHGYTNTDMNRQKFTQKERDNETGLDFFEARYFSSTQGRFTSVDPLMASGSLGSPQSWNRYSYCFNNPLRFTDPSGMLAGDFYDQEGKRLGTDGVNDGKVYVVTDQAQAKQIQQTDKNKGTTQVSGVSSAIELPGLDVRTAIGAAVDRSNSPTTDDTKGGFHEEGLQWGTDANGQAQIVNAAPGAYSNPQVNTEATITVTTAANSAQQGILTTVAGSAHVHPKGEIKIEEGPKPQPGQVIFGGTIKTTTYNFNQFPSPRDVSNARPGANIVVGARDKKVYIYDSSGTRATFPLNKFLSIGKK